MKRSLSLSTLLLTGIAGAAGPRLATEDLRIPGADPGIELHLRHHFGADGRRSRPGGIVLFVHGATFPSVAAFDAPVGNATWLSRTATLGFDTYALDIRGYGGSTRPAAMSQPPEANAPFATTREAVRDIGAAVDYLLQRRRAGQVTLVGWSWGTTTVAAYAAEHPGKVGRLVLVAPVWLPVTPPEFKGAWRASTAETARAFMTRGIPPSRVEEISPRATFEAWWRVALQTDPEGAKQAPPIVRSPNGVLQDFRDFWAAGKPTYDPAAIRAPTLLVVGEWDAVTPPSMALQLFERLTGTRERKVTILGEGTHFMALEKNHERLWNEVHDFISRGPPCSSCDPDASAATPTFPATRATPTSVPSNARSARAAPTGR